MRPVSVNFARRGTIGARLGIACAIVIVVGALNQAWSAWQATQQARAMELRSAELRRVLLDRAEPGRILTESAVPSYAGDAAGLVRGAEFDVGFVLGALEAVRVPGVKVVGIELIPAEASARVEIELAEPSALVKYLDELNAGLEPAQSWRLVRAQAAIATAVGTATIVAASTLTKK